MAEAVSVIEKEHALKAQVIKADVAVFPNGDTVTINHGRDSLGARVCQVRDRTTGALIALAESGATTMKIEHVSDTQTVITNNYGGAKPAVITLIVFSS